MTKNYEIIDGRCVIPHVVSHIVYKEFESAHSLREVVIGQEIVRRRLDTFDNLTIHFVNN